VLKIERSIWRSLIALADVTITPHEALMLKLMIKHFNFSFYLNYFAFLHSILLITFDREKISQKAQCYVHQLIQGFPVIYNMYITFEIYF
jgi:hypothetical protein